jgi:peptide/nickel transport system substrate-binding protein
MAGNSALIEEQGVGRWTRRQFIKTSLVLGIGAAGGGGFLLGACQTDDDDDDPDVGAGETPEPEEPDEDDDTEDEDEDVDVAPGGVLVVGWEEDTATLDPSKQICAHEVRVGGQFSETLWTLYGDSTEIQPALATSWEASEDGLTWDVDLRENVLFHDGTECDAEAVKWSFDRWLDESHPFHDPPYGLLTYYLGALESVETTGDLSIRLILSQVDAVFETNGINQRAGVVSPTALEAMGMDQFGVSPVCTGPWKVTEWERGVRIIFDRNEDYWGEQPRFDRLIIRPIVESAQRLSQLQSGEVDMVIAMPPEFIPTVEEDPNLQLIQSPGLHIWWLTLNMHEEHMQHREVRQALNYAVNKQAIIDVILQGAGVVTPGPMIPHSFATDASVEPYPHDPERARELLAEAGYPDGFTTRFWVPDSGSGMVAPREIGQVIQANLAEVGVTAEIVTQEWTSYVADWGGEGLDKDGEAFYGMGQMSWNFASDDPAQWLNPTVRGDAHPPNAFNGGFYANPEVDALLHEADETLGLDDRAALFQEAQRLMREDCPWVFMFSANNIAAATARLQGVTLNPNPSIVRFTTGYFED